MRKRMWARAHSGGSSSCGGCIIIWEGAPAAAGHVWQPLAARWVQCPRRRAAFGCASLLQKHPFALLSPPLWQSPPCAPPALTPLLYHSTSDALLGTACPVHRGCTCSYLLQQECATGGKHTVPTSGATSITSELTLYFLPQSVTGHSPIAEPGSWLSWSSCTLHSNDPH